MKNSLLFGALLTGFAVFTIACQSSSKTVTDSRNNPFQTYKECKDPRPEACTREIDPVCAKRDTGVRCVTTPCPSEENITLGNACTACSDPKVFGYVKGACPE